MLVLTFFSPTNTSSSGLCSYCFIQFRFQLRMLVVACSLFYWECVWQDVTVLVSREMKKVRSDFFLKPQYSIQRPVFIETVPFHLLKK